MQTIDFVKHCCLQHTALTGDDREDNLPSHTLYPHSQSIILNAGRVWTETSLPSGCLPMIFLQHLSPFYLWTEGHIWSWLITPQIFSASVSACGNGSV